MKRAFIPGAVDRHGIAHPLPHCTGNCHGGSKPCTCSTGCTELGAHLGPSAERVIQPPTCTPEDESALARIRCGTIALTLAGFCTLAALLELFGASPFEVSK